MLSHIQTFEAPWTVARHAPLPMEFSTQEYWSGLPCPPPGDHPNQGTEPRSSALQVDSLLTEPPGVTLYVLTFENLQYTLLCKNLTFRKIKAVLT